MNPSPFLSPESEILVLRARSVDGLLREIQALSESLGQNPGQTLRELSCSVHSRGRSLPLCLAVTAASFEALASKLSWASGQLSDPSTREIRGKKGVYFSKEPLGPGAKLAVLFPGEGSQHPYMLRELCLAFPFVRAWFDRMDRAFVEKDLGDGFLPSRIVFPVGSGARRAGTAEDMWRMAGAVAAVLTANQALWDLVRRLGISPDAVAGHSTGEYTALRAAGILDVEDEDRFQEYVADLYRIYKKSAAKGEIPSVRLLAVGSDLERVRSVLDQISSGLHVAMDNCPHQVVVVGEEQEAERAAREFARLGMIHQTLPFDRPYHTPLFTAYARNLKPFFDKWLTRPPNLTIYSCAAADRFPEDLAEIRKLALDHWVKPVRFRQTVERMYEEGFRVFVEAGPKGNLTSFIHDILRERKHLAVAADVPSRPGMSQLHHLAALLCSQGVPVDLDLLAPGKTPSALPLGRAYSAEKEGKPDALQQTMTIELELPRLRLSVESLPRIERAGQVDTHTEEHVSSPLDSTPNRDGREPVPHLGPEPSSLQREEADPALEAYFRTMERFLEVQREVMLRYLGSEEPSVDELLPEDLRSGHAFLQKENLVPQPAPEPPPAGGVPERSAAAPTAIPDLRDELLSLVSEKTGYPVEMLDPAVNLEADLGIDSIKRIEILASLWEKHPELPRENLEKAAVLKTLAEVIAFLENPDRKKPPADGSSAQDAATMAELRTGLDPCVDFPLIDEVVSFQPGENLRARRRFDLEHDRFLLDHTIGGKVSDAHPEWQALPVMPLTMSMEMMAEAASLLLPGRVLTGMRDVRAYRWISFERTIVTLEAVARLKPGAKEEVEVILVDADPPPDPGQGRPLVEGVMVFGDRYPEETAPQEPTLGQARRSRWAPRDLYRGRMFHGPCWQAVRSIDRWSENGSISTFEVLPRDGFFDPPRPGPFVTDPILLDAAGQIVGFWTMEHLEEGFLVFPYRLRSLRIYRSHPRVREPVRCLARIRLVGSHQVTSDIDLVGADGRLWMRLEGWEDKRFGLPASAYTFLLSPRETVSGRRWDAPIASFPDASEFVCLALDRLFHDDSAFWIQVFSRLLLNPTEQERFASIGSSEERRIQWLMGRLVAKDAVRTYLREQRSLEVAPADIEIRQDEQGRPYALGPWLDETSRGICLSFAHTNGLCVAVAGPSRGNRSVGIDIEKVRPLGEGFETVAFSASEQKLLGTLAGPHRLEWLIRCWSAKEAAAKALGTGLAQGPRSLVVESLDETDGWVLVRPEGKLAESFPHLGGRPLRVRTLREGDYIVASALVHRGEGNG